MFLTGSLTFIAHIFPLNVRNSDLLHSKHSDEWLNLTLPHIRGYYNHIWPQWTTSHAKSPTVICGHEESGVLVVVNVWRLAVQYGSGGDVAFEGVHDQPVCWVSQYCEPERHTWPLTVTHAAYRMSLAFIVLKSLSVYLTTFYSDNPL